MAKRKTGEVSTTKASGKTTSGAKAGSGKGSGKTEKVSKVHDHG